MDRVGFSEGGWGWKEEIELGGVRLKWVKRVGCLCLCGDK